MPLEINHKYGSKSKFNEVDKDGDMEVEIFPESLDDSVFLYLRKEQAEQIIAHLKEQFNL